MNPLKGMSTADLAVVSKLHRGKDTTSRRGGNRQLPELTSIARTVNRTANNNNDAKNLFQVLPDMELAKSILISSIISPNDLSESKVVYSLKKNSFDDRLTGPMLAVIEDNFDNYYKINRDLYTYLEDALFMKGSHPILILPESSIDALINSDTNLSMESLYDDFEKNGNLKSYGILGRPDANGNYNRPTFENLFLDNSSERFQKATVSLEAMQVVKELPGAKGNKVSVGGVYVTDNLTLLRRPAIEEKLRRTAQSNIYSSALGRARKAKSGEDGHIPVISTEATGPKKPDMSLDHIERLFYKNRVSSSSPVQTVLTRKQVGRESVGHPLWVNLPSEAVIPIHVPGNPKKHMGYFIVNDMHGNPLCLDSVSDYYNEIRSTLQSDNSLASSLMGTARRMGDGYNMIETTEIEAMQRTYQNMVETDLLNRLRSGVLTGEFELSNVQEVYSMMLARSLANKQTMLLYVPAEMMIYIAFDYNEYGVGKSMIEGGKTLGSMRAVMMVANTLGATGNMINGKNVNFTIPEEDEDPASTVSYMMGEWAKLNRSGAAIGETNPNEIINRLQEAAVTFTVQGNTRYPEARTEVSTAEGTNKLVDKEWDDELRRRHYQMFSLTPEIVDGVGSAEFATTVVNQSIMMTKRVLGIQEEFNPFLTRIVQTCSYSSGEILDQLRRVIRESDVELPEEYGDDINAFIDDFIDSLVAELPSPETSTLKSKIEAFEEYSQSIDTAMKAYIDENLKVFVSDNVSPDHITQVASAISGMLKRRYLREKNILPELDIFNPVNELDDPEYNWMTALAEDYGSTVRIVEKFVEKVIRKDLDNKELIDSNQQKIETLSQGGDVTFDDAGGDLDDDTGLSDDGMGGDDNLDDEFADTIPVGDAPEEDVPPAEEEEEPDLDLDIPPT